LDEAVKEEFLVPLKSKQVDLGFVSRGIQYDELSGEEQQRYEETFRDEHGNFPTSKIRLIRFWTF